MQIQLPEDFSVEWLLHHIRTSSYGSLYHFAGRRVLRRPLWLAGLPVVVEFDLTRAGMVELRLVSRRGPVAGRRMKGTALLDELAEQVRFLWGLDDDAAGHHAAMAADHDLAPLLERFGALRILRAPDVYEALFIAVIGQQLSVRSAQSIRRRLAERLGTKITVADSRGEERYALYPSPGQLIAAGEGALQSQGASRQKAACLVGIAHRAVAGELDRGVFAPLSDEDARERLSGIKGVGRWTAELVLMLGLGRPDIFPAGDLGLRGAAQKVLGLPEKPQEKVMREIAGRWAGWRSYAALYLWMSLRETDGVIPAPAEPEGCRHGRRETVRTP